MDTYGRDLRAARLARGWSRQRLAEESGATLADVDHAESGHRNDRIAEALQLEEFTALFPQASADFLRYVQSVVRHIPADRRPVAFAAVLDILGRSAAGADPGDIRQINVVQGDATIDQRCVS